MWNPEIISQIALDDKTETKLPTRVAQRIADKGFHLLDCRIVSGAESGFHWGRSSHGRVTKKLYTITFEDDQNQEFAVLVVDQTVTYTRCNPYDRAPKNRRSTSVQATEESKAALGWKK